MTFTSIVLLVIGAVLVALALRLVLRGDRRGVFLLMGLAVLIPVALKPRFPEVVSPLVQATFDAVENLPPGSNVLMAMDYEPGTEPELQPMATAWTRHVCLRGHKVFFITLLPLGPIMTANTIRDVVRAEFPDYQYGVDYVNLGYKAGYEGVIKVIITDLKKQYSTDAAGANINDLPITRDLTSVQQMDLIVSLSGSYPGTKEWVQYACTPFGIPMVAGCTGVQAPETYPYVPNPIVGLLGGLKAAAEYEYALGQKYPQYAGFHVQLGRQRMGPQLVGHLLILLLIVVGNIIYFAGRRREQGGQR